MTMPGDIKSVDFRIHGMFLTCPSGENRPQTMFGKSLREPNQIFITASEEKVGNNATFSFGATPALPKRADGPSKSKPLPEPVGRRAKTSFPLMAFFI